MQTAVQSRMELEMDLRMALENDEFFLVYQPTFSLQDMSPTGMEALIRWNSPTRGVVQPDDFIPLLEETGLIVDDRPLGACARRARRRVRWREAGHPIGVAVNVSARQLDTDEFVERCRSALERVGPGAELLTIEITETALMRDIEADRRAARRRSRSWACGSRSTTSAPATPRWRTCSSFPVDALKIDRSFIAQMTHNREGETILHTLVQLGKALSIETLAEGIEQHPGADRCYRASAATAARASCSHGRSSRTTRRRSCANGSPRRQSCVSDRHPLTTVCIPA